MSPKTTRLSSALVCTTTLLTSLLIARGAIAQSLPTCQPPATGEYLLLVLNETAQTPTQLQQTLPPNASTTVCNYLGREVTRVGGFNDPEVASSWAQYLSDIGGLQAFVARPPDSVAVTPTPLPTAPAPVPLPPSSPSPATPVALPPTDSTSPSVNPPTAVLPPASTPQPVTPQPISPPTATVPAPVATGAIPPEQYSPQLLGAGYAVLVDYDNRPDLAAQVQLVLNRPIGLVAFEQRPYLLAVHTSDAEVASTILQMLSSRQFTAAIVDSSRAVLLTPAIVTE